MRFPIGRVVRTNLSIAIDNGINCGMTTTIRLGKAGRFVVPKSIRDGLGLREGSRLRIDVSEESLRRRPNPMKSELSCRAGFPSSGADLPEKRETSSEPSKRGARSGMKESSPRADANEAALDTSIIVGALDGDDPDHAACRKLLLSAKFSIHSHALSETFDTLTGGRLAIRISAADAAAILRHQVAPRLAIHTSRRSGPAESV